MNLKKGSVVEIDCGYWGIDDTRPCKLLEDPRPTATLWDASKIEWVAMVKILGTDETFTAILSK